MIKEITMYTLNLSPSIARTNVVTDDLIQQLLTTDGCFKSITREPTLVQENGSGYELSEADAYARRLAEEAEAWLAHTRTRARMKDETVVRKALASLAFSFRHRTHDFAVPSKITGVSMHQQTLWQMVKNHVGFGTPLRIEEQENGTSTRPRLVVFYDGDELGEVQSKHVPWLRPLLPFGARLYLVRITGREQEYTLGCNVAFSRVGGAVTALNHALGTDTGSDGDDAYGGDELPEGKMRLVVRPVLQQHRSLHNGDGADGVTQPPAPTMEEVIRFWRDEQGTLRMNIPHVKQHSPSGPEVAFAGSGPADAALSVLCAVTGREEAERWYQLFKHEVIARLPESGGAITRASVRRWLAEKRNDR
jgi:hypothetical protein